MTAVFLISPRPLTRAAPLLFQQEPDRSLHVIASDQTDRLIDRRGLCEAFGNAVLRPTRRGWGRSLFPDVERTVIRIYQVTYFIPEQRAQVQPQEEVCIIPPVELIRKVIVEL